jgi:CPA2 family monovalent cation:H+ antiporter-2
VFFALVEESISRTIAEIGGLFVLLGIVARVAFSLRVASAPLFLLVGLGLGVGGVVQFDASEPFIAVSAEVGALLLLLFLGLEYSAETIVRETRLHLRTAVVDILLNATPGVIVGLVLGWSPTMILAMAGVTYVSSSGISTQVAREMGWRNRPEWDSLVSVLVLEDLVMAPYLPILTALGAAISVWSGLLGVGFGLAVVSILLFVGAKGVTVFAPILTANSGAALLLTTLGLALLAGGVAGIFGFSPVVAAFFVGLLITGEMAELVRTRIAALRDVFAAVFFVFFGIQTHPGDMLPALPLAIVLVAVTWATKVATAYYALRRSGHAGDELKWCALRGGSLLSARGEFSIAIGGLVFGFGIAPDDWQPVVAAYVIVSAIVGPMAARAVDRRQAIA